MSYTTALIFATLLHNQAANIDTNSKYVYIAQNSVNSSIIDVLEKRGLAKILENGTVVIRPTKIEESFKDSEAIDTEVLDAVVSSPHTTSW